MPRKYKYVYKLIFSDETIVSDEKYDTLDEALDAGREAINDYNAGGDVLHLSNPGEYPAEWESPELEATIEDD